MFNSVPYTRKIEHIKRKNINLEMNCKLKNMKEKLVTLIFLIERCCPIEKCERKTTQQHLVSSLLPVLAFPDNRKSSHPCNFELHISTSLQGSTEMIRYWLLTQHSLIRTVEYVSIEACLNGEAERQDTISDPCHLLYQLIVQFYCFTFGYYL